MNYTVLTGMRHAVSASLLSLAIVAGATLAGAQETAGARGHHGPQLNFEELDLNQDGALSKSEMAAHRQAHFLTLDADGDGLVSEAELRTHMQQTAEARIERRVSRMMERHDANKDGQISTEEMAQHREGRMFERIDSDGDGSISRDEFDAMQAKMIERMNKG